MGLTDFALRRLAPAAAASSVAAWAGLTTINDDWDDYFPSTSAAASGEPEKIVILGSGWAALNALRKCAGPNKAIVVVSPRPHFLYTPLLASSAVGTITLRSACEPLRALVEDAARQATSATFVRADAREIDLRNKTVIATTGSEASGMELELSYDKLVVAVGTQPNWFGIPGVKEHGLFLKEAEDSAKLHARLLNNLEKASALSYQEGEKYQTEIDRLLKVVIVGGGPTGVELSAELADFVNNDVAKRYGTNISERCQIILVEMMPRILAPFDASLATVAKDHLISKGVEVRTGWGVTHVESTDVTMQPSTPRNATTEQKAAASAAAQTEEIGALVWVGGIGARPLVTKLAKALGQKEMRGLLVDENLKVKGTEGVYAIGDAAFSGFAPTAQVASQQGKHIGRAIRDGVDTKFEYTHMGTLCSLGRDNGLAQLKVPSGSYVNIWDQPSIGKDGDEQGVTGKTANILWSSLYYTKLLSASSQFQLVSDWVTARFSGRDVVEPVLQRTATMRPPVESFGTTLKRNSTIRVVSKSATKVEALATDPPEGNKKKRFWLF